MLVYEFGSFSLDLVEHCLRQKDKVIDLPPRLLEVLRLLVENSGRIITKEELMLKVWHDAAVEDGNITVSIAKLRKILGENTHTPKYIATIPRRGYRFVADVSFGQLRTRNTLAIPSVEVQGHLVAKVFSKQHSFKGTLGDRDTGVFLLEATYPEENGEAYREYLKGRHWWSRHTKESLMVAVKHYEQALASDGNFTEAHAAVADCYLRLTTNYYLPGGSNQWVTGPIASSVPDGMSEHNIPLSLKDEWDRATAQREWSRTADLNFSCPGPDQWRAIYIYCQNLYREALVTNINKQKSVWGQTKETLIYPQGDTYPLRTAVKLNELMQIFCIVARDQIEVGNFEAGYLLLQPWYATGEWPCLEGLTPEASADLLFTAGLLAGRLGNSRQLPRGQVHAEALLNGAISLFEQLGLKTRVGECRSELGRCYDRQGMADLARVTLLSAIDELPEHEQELKSRAILRLAYAETKVGRLHDSLARLNDVREQALDNPSTAHFFHIEMATALGELAIAQNSDDYFNLACEHYRDVLMPTEAVGHHHRTAVLESNHGYLLLAFNNLKEAEIRLLRARSLFDHFSNRCPQLDETLARLHLEIGQFDFAEKAIIRSVTALESCGEEALLAESLRTQGQVWCKLGRHRAARRVLDRAYHLAKACEDTEGAGLALLILIEEMSEFLEDAERLEFAATARSLVRHSQRISVLKRIEKSLALGGLTTPH